MRLGRDFWRFQAGSFAFLVGSRAYQLAVAWWALEKTGSASTFGALIAYSTLAEIVAKPTLGWLGDRYPRRNVIVACNAVAAASASMILLLAFLNLFSPGVVACFLVAFGAASGIRDPIEASLLPMLVPEVAVADAFRVRSMTQSLALLLGPAAAGVLVSAVGVRATLGISIAAIVAAGLSVNRVAADTRPAPQPVVERRGPLLAWAHNMSDGFRAVFHIHTELCLALLAMFINVALYPFFLVLLPLLVKEHLRQPAWFVGVLDSSFGIGVLLASSLLVKPMNARIGRDLTVFLGFLLLGVSLVFIGVVQVYWALPPFMVLGGVGLLFVNMNTSVLRTLATPEGYRARVNATVAFVSSMLNPLGSYGAGLLVHSFGIGSAIVILGAIVTGEAIVVLLVPNWKRVMRMPESEMKGAYATLYPRAFEGGWAQARLEGESIPGRATEADPSSW